MSKSSTQSQHLVFYLHKDLSKFVNVRASELTESMTTCQERNAKSWGKYRWSQINHNCHVFMALLQRSTEEPVTMLDELIMHEYSF